MKNKFYTVLCLCFLFTSFLSFGQSENIYVPYKSGEFWGMADTNGVILIQPRFQKIKQIGSNIFSVCKELCDTPQRKYGLIDHNNNFLLDYKYHSIYFEDGFLKGLVAHRGFDLFDNKLNPIFDNKDDLISLKKLDSNLYIIKYGKKAGIVKFKSGTTTIDSWILERKYNSITYYSSSTIETNLNGLIQTYSVEGLKKDVVTPESILLKPDEEMPKFMDIPYPTPSVAKDENKRKIIKPTGKHSLIYRYESKSYTLILQKIHQYFIVNKPKLESNIEPVEYDTLGKNFKHIDVHSFYNLVATKKDSSFSQKGIRTYDIAIVTNKNGKKGCFDGFGNQLLPQEYDDIDKWHILIHLEKLPLKGYETKYFLCKKSNKYGIVDEWNNIVLDFEYDKVIRRKKRINVHFQNDKIITMKNGKFGINDFHNMTIIKHEMDSINYLITGDPYLNQYGFLLKKDSLYGLLTHNNDFIFPQYSYEPGNIKMIQGFLLIEMIDKKGTFLGYADRKGTLYFEEEEK